MKKEKNKNRNNDIRPEYVKLTGREQIYSLDINEPIDTDTTEREIVPQLFWPVYEYVMDRPYYDNNINFKVRDQLSFPGFENYCRSIDCLLRCKENKYTRNVFVRTVFMDSLRRAKTAYIIDQFFGEEEYNSILSNLTMGAYYVLEKLFIICGRNYECLNNRVKQRNQEEKYIRTEIRVANLGVVESRYFDIHDRFALLDDEIWHFGWTVGGIGSVLTAYSRGWKDINSEFKKYLDRIVNPG